MAARGLTRAAVGLAVAGALGVTSVMARGEPPRGLYGGYGYGDRPCEASPTGDLAVLEALLELLGIDSGDGCEDTASGLLDLLDMLPREPAPDGATAADARIDAGANGADRDGGGGEAHGTGGASATTDSDRSTGTTTGLGGSETTGPVDALLGGADAGGGGGSSGVGDDAGSRGGGLVGLGRR